MTVDLLTFVFSMLFTMALIPIFCGMASRLGILLDVPNERKVHLLPIPKVGGIAMTIGIIAPLLFWGDFGEFAQAALLGAGIIVLFGLIDDIWELHFLGKFAGQFIAAFLVIYKGGLLITDLGTILPGVSSVSPFISILLTAGVIVGVTNAINLADGLDGLAGGICMLSFITIAYFAHSLGMRDIVLLALAVSGAIFGFLRFNTYPATIFMGDTGSQLLGFLAVTLALKLTQGHSPFSPYLSLLIIGFPILDTVVVSCERVAAGKSPFIADKNHLHHKLIRLGFFHTEAVFHIYVMQIVYVTSAFFFRFYTDRFILLFYLIFSTLIASFLIVSDKYGFRLQRFDIIDRVIKGKLRVLRKDNLLIKISFRFVLASVPLLLLFSCFFPASLPVYYSYFPVVQIILLLVVWLVRREWVEGVIRICLFVTIPYVVYFAEVDPVTWIPETVFLVYNIWGGITVVFILLTMKLTRRTEGLKATPLHFLILFFALIIPNLPVDNIGNVYLGMIAAKTILFFFGFEVLIGELRNKMDWLCLITLVSFVVLTLKVFWGV